MATQPAHSFSHVSVRVPSYCEICSIFSFRISSSTVSDRIFFGCDGCRGPQRVRFPVEVGGNTQAVAIVFGVNPQDQRATAASEAARSCDADAVTSVHERPTARTEVRRLLRSSASCFFLMLGVFVSHLLISFALSRLVFLVDRRRRRFDS